jgi:hypothetical protein
MRAPLFGSTKLTASSVESNNIGRHKEVHCKVEVDRLDSAAFAVDPVDLEYPARPNAIHGKPNEARVVYGHCKDPSERRLVSLDRRSRRLLQSPNGVIDQGLPNQISDAQSFLLKTIIFGRDDATHAINRHVMPPVKLLVRDCTASN